MRLTKLIVRFSPRRERERFYLFSHCRRVIYMKTILLRSQHTGLTGYLFSLKGDYIFTDQICDCWSFIRKRTLLFKNKITLHILEIMFILSPVTEKINFHQKIVINFFFYILLYCNRRNKIFVNIIYGKQRETAAGLKRMTNW